MNDIYKAAVRLLSAAAHTAAAHTEFKQEVLICVNSLCNTLCDPGFQAMIRTDA